jgi:hypothetical protein
MAYIGVSPSNGVRKKHTYTATASQTSFSGAGAEGITLAYRDSNYVDVYQNGVKLADEDYTATSGTAIVLAQGASADDIVEIIAFDVFSVADTVSKADGGTFDGNVAMAGTLGVTGVLTANGGAVFNEGGADVDFRVESDTVADALFLEGSSGNVAIGKSVPLSKLDVTGGFITVSKDANTAGRVGASEYITGDPANDLIVQATGSAITRFYQSGVNSLNIDATGAVTMPLQPAFLAKPASLQTNLALNTDVTIVFGTEIFDQNGDFASNTFTAPVTGKYQINVHVYFNALDVDGTFYEIKIITSNRNHVHVIDMRPFDADAPNWSFNASVLTDMDASDTAYIAVKPYNTGAAQADVAVESHFSGYLVA